MMRLLFLLLLLPCALCAQEIRIGSKPFPEGRILGELITQRLQSDGAKSVEHEVGLGGTGVIWKALLEGEIQVYAEYTGTLQRECYATEAPSDFEATELLMQRDGIVVVARLGFNNTYALGVKEELARRLGINTISDLIQHPDLAFGFSNEFKDRADGWPGLRDRYNLAHTNVTGMQHELAYEALDAGKIDVTELYSTDASIEQLKLRTLQDDLGFFPDYSAVIVARADFVQRHPELLAALQQFEGAINEEQMVAMNAAVVVDKIPEAAVARNFLARLKESEKGGEAPTADDIRSAGKRSLRERVNDALVDLPRLSFQHLAMVFLSLVAGMLVAIPLGIVAHRRPRIGQFILGGAGILQTVPSIALLVLLIPLVGIGWWPAVIALFLYSLLPIIRNTHAGLKDIDPSLLESADALGLSRAARLRLVELPLAGRSVLAGVKIAAVINVGTATLGGFIGAGGYGEAIFSGISRQDNVQILSGAIPAAVIALILQGLFELMERAVIPRGLRLQQRPS